MRALGIALALLFTALMLKGQLLALPAVPDQAGAGDFDTGRAMARLERVLGDERAHPVDSEANDAVRARLIAELVALGLTPRVSDDFACNSSARGRSVSCARVRNVVATIGNAEAPGHVLVVSHYDSTVAGPGAGDDGIGVATMLELAAQLRGRALDRPVTFLFNEGEEAGLIGARAFLDTDPLASRVRSLVNLEARGVDGPAFMFETSRPNGPAIAAFAQAVDRPVANSMMTDFYRMIPNSTDVAVFEERPWTILNFAIGGNETRYHSAGDTIAALDPRSVRHMGTQALALVTELAQESPQAAAGERVYLDLAGRQLVVMPVTAALTALAVLILLFAWIGWRRRGGIAIALAAMVAALGGSAAIAWLGQTLVRLIRSGDYWRGYPDLTSAAVYLAAMLAVVAALTLARRVEVGTLRAAFWLLLLLLGSATSLVAPAGSILFLFPPIAAAAGIILGRRWPAAERIGALVAAALLFLLFGPFLHLLELLLGHRSAWMFAPLAAAILLPFLTELSPLIRENSRRYGLALTGAATLIGWATVAAAPAYSEDRQQQFTLEYAWDADAGRARWAVNNDGAPLPESFATLGPWQREALPYSPRRRWVAAAEPQPVPHPALEISSSRPAPGGRVVQLRLRSGGADTLLVKLPAEARVQAVRSGAFDRLVGGGDPDDPYYIRCSGRACDGARLELLLQTDAPMEALLTGIRSGLPRSGQALLDAMPPHARPQYGTHSIVAVKRVRL